MKRSITSKPPSQRLFVNARVIDPSRDLDMHADVLVTKGKIKAIGKDLPRDNLKKSCKITDCKGMVLAPGLVDARVFIGEPGGEHRETIKSASRAAASGGVTSLVMMPEPDPVIDNAALVEYVRQTAGSGASQSDQLAKLAELHDAGSIDDDEYAKAKARVLDD